MKSSICEKKRAKDLFAFPKISKVEASPSDNKVFVKGGRKYAQQNIFKM